MLPELALGSHGDRNWYISSAPGMLPRFLCLPSCVIHGVVSHMQHSWRRLNHYSWGAPPCTMARSYFFCWNQRVVEHRGTLPTLKVVGRQHWPLSLSSTWSSQIFQHVLLSKMVSVSRLYLYVLVHHGSEHHRHITKEILWESHEHPM